MEAGIWNRHSELSCSMEHPRLRLYRSHEERSLSKLATGRAFIPLYVIVVLQALCAELTPASRYALQ
jgi:hypothetical protein